MFKELINKFKILKSSISEDETINEIKPLCNVSCVNGIYILTINENMSISDYSSLKGTEKKIFDLIASGVTWDSHKQAFSKGTYYIIEHDNIVYNILVNDEKIKLEERISYDKYTQEKIITITYSNNNLDYFRCFHDLEGSTYNTHYYNDDDKGIDLGELELSKNEAFNEIDSMLTSLHFYTGMYNIIDFNYLNSILDDIFSESLTIKNRTIL